MSAKRTVHPVPDSAVPIREIGPWTIYALKSDRSFYIQPSDGSIAPLKLSLDEILHLVKGMGGGPAGAKGSRLAVSGREGKKESAGAEKHKRQFKRYTRRCEAEFSTGDLRIRGIASDFSLNGLFLKTNYPAAEDAQITIAVHLPDGATSYLKGKVRRSMKSAIGKAMGASLKSLKNGMGVELTEKDAAYLNFIRSLL